MVSVLNRFLLYNTADPGEINPFFSCFRLLLYLEIADSLKDI